MINSTWQCAHCGQHTLLSPNCFSVSTVPLNKNSRLNAVGINTLSVSCANDACRELTVHVTIGPLRSTHSSHTGTTYSIDRENAVYERQLIPEGKLLQLPDDVPEEIRITYKEAVAVAEISGRAGAAMARRCLQGVVRDFFQIPPNKRGNLGAELSYVRDKIDPQLWDDIAALRSIGDIGAHMDNNVNEIIDVSPNEARILIRLLETLFSDWYIARAKRRLHSAELAALLGEKRTAQKVAKTGSKDAPPLPPKSSTMAD